MNDVLLDAVLIMKLLWFAMYTFVELLIRNLVPAAYLNKNIKGEIVLITGAGWWAPPKIQINKFFDFKSYHSKLYTKSGRHRTEFGQTLPQAGLHGRLHRHKRVNAVAAGERAECRVCHRAELDQESHVLLQVGHHIERGGEAGGRRDQAQRGQGGHSGQQCRDHESGQAVPGAERT